MTNTVVGSRVDRRRERTRQRLIEVGRRLIADKGVAGLRIQEITDEVDIAAGSFYSHFPTKDDLVEAVAAESLAELGAATVSTQGGAQQDPAVTTAFAIRRVVRLAFDDPGFARLVVNLNHADALFATAFHPFARSVVLQGVESKRFETPDIEVSVNLVVTSSLALIRAILDGQHAEGVEVSHAEVSLRSLGVSRKDAQRISRLPLPSG